MNLARESARCSLFCLGAFLLLGGSAGNPCGLRILGPNPAFVQFGGSLSLNCTTTCAVEAAFKGWETSLRKREVNQDTYWTSTTLADVREWISSPKCYIIDLMGDHTVTNTMVRAFQPPKDVIIDFPPVMEVGQSYSLSCSVLNIAPMRYLTVLIRRWNETLHTEMYADDLTDGSTSVTVTHTITAQRTDHGAQYNCLAQLDLSPNGGIFEKSASTSVHTFDLPEEPVIHALNFAERGSEVTVRCEVIRAFPPEGLEVALLLEGEELNATEARDGDTLVAEAIMSLSVSGWHTLQCRVIITPDKIARRVETLLYSYNFPEPVLHVKDLNTLAGNDVIITCTLPEADPPQALVIIAGRTMFKTCEGVSNMPCSFTLRAQKGDNRMKVRCEATLMELKVTKHTSLTLNVAYGPEFSATLCPSPVTWLEGTSATLSCEADGNPAPRVECAKDGRPRPIGNWPKVTSDHSGVYQCEATNQHGRSAKNVTVIVEYGPAFRDALCPSPLTWAEGTQATFSCEAHGNPAPRVECTKDGGPNAIGHWLKITRNQSGIYQCLADNKHGRSIRNITVAVEYAPEFQDSLCPSFLTWVEGTRATFSCEADGNPPPAIECTKDGGPNAIRHWPKITRHDAGTYGCNASNARGFDVKNVKVTVEYEPEFSDSLCPSRLTWVEGTQATFACEADGNPVPDVQCTRDGGSNVVGHWPKITRAHSATYRCNASNRLGSDAQDVTVTIEYAPEFSDRLCPSPLTWVEGAQATFSCAADGNPRPRVECTKDGGPNAVGRWPAIARRDSGSYRCNASNTHGFDVRAVEVKVEYGPEFSDSLCPSPLTWIEGTRVTFSCRANGNPAPHVQCTKDGGKNAIGDWPKIGRHSSGTYQCSATNKHGSDVKYVKATVEYKPMVSRIEIDPSGSVYEGAKVTLSCQAGGLPAPTYSWRTPDHLALTFSRDNRTVTIAGAESRHSGVYTCEVENVHGRDTQQKEVHVHDRLPTILGAAFGALGLAAIAGVSAKTYLHYRARKCKAYELAKAQEALKGENPDMKMAQFQICDS